ncbi:MAG: TetR/AcrR family transcriptional regulator [Chloroflexota bacterium]
MSVKTEQKTELIIVTALHILAEQGDQGLTMRQVAKRAEMSLSNVQYYFRTKDALLAALIDFYLNESYEAYYKFIETIPEQDKPEATIRFLLINPDMEFVCRVFKELWAISERNDVVKKHLANHYRFYAEQLGEGLQALATPECPKRNIDQAVSLILPLVEGYQITRDAIPLDAEALVQLLTAEVLRLIGR